MDVSIDKTSPLKLVGPGRFTKASVQTPAGELEARLSEAGYWELRIRRHHEPSWRVACSGDLESGKTTTSPVEREVLNRGSLTIDPESRTVTVGGVCVTLRPKEFALLLMLASIPDRVFTKVELMTSVWGYPDSARSRTVDHHAARLRKRLREAGADGLIVNSWGFGYRFWDRPDLNSFLPDQATGGVA